jgi:hypothetical protein
MGKFYEFVFRGMLTDVALDKTLGPHRQVADGNLADITRALSLEVFDPEYLEPAARMAVVYTAIAAFENSVRRFVLKVLLDSKGEGWWTTCVSEKIRKAAEIRHEDEQKTKWHGTRGTDLLSYTELGQLVNIMQQNWSEFEPYVQRIDWATSIFNGIERSRNVIMHSGTLDIEDVERVGILIRDWTKQVGL